MNAETRQRIEDLLAAIVADRQLAIRADGTAWKIAAHGGTVSPAPMVGATVKTMLTILAAPAAKGTAQQTVDAVAEILAALTWRDYLTALRSEGVRWVKEASAATRAEWTAIGLDIGADRIVWRP